MINLQISVDSDGWADEAALEENVRAALEAALAETEIILPEGAEVSIVFTDDTAVQALNRDWRDKNKPTNVLSFAANDTIAPDHWSPLLGDIVLARETIEREAREQGKSFNDHLTHLVIHGFLHLVGFDHIEDDEAEAMETIERRALLHLGIADPYADT